MFFQRKQTLATAATGKVIPLSAVRDEVFATNMMGAGYAVVEHDGLVYAPVTGVVDSIFPTKHAITIKTAKDLAVLVHMGLDTVDLKGAPFELMVAPGDHVKTGQLLARMDLTMLEKHQRDSVLLVVLPDVHQGKVLPQSHGTVGQVAFKY